MTETVGRLGDITKQVTQAAVGTVSDSIADTLARGEDVFVVAFGRFVGNDRPAREGRNPRTDKRIAVGPSSGVSFKTGKVLKDALK